MSRILDVSNIHIKQLRLVFVFNYTFPTKTMFHKINLICHMYFLNDILLSIIKVSNSSIHLYTTKYKYTTLRYSCAEN